MKRIFRFIFGGILIGLALPLGLLGAVIGFVGTAILTHSIFLLCVGGIVLCFGICFGLTLVAGRMLFSSSRYRFALGFSVGLVVIVMIASVFTVFQPLVPSSERTISPVPPQVSFWDLESGSHIAYRHVPSVENTQNYPVIYVHGGPAASSVAVEPIIETFSSLIADGYDVYFYDQIGGGYSGRLDDIREYSLARHLEDLEAVRLKIGADKMILIGESWGGELVTYYLASHPERVEKCILVSPGPLYPKEWGDQEPCDARNTVSEEKQQGFTSLLKSHLIRLIGGYLLLEVNPSAARNFIKDPEADAFTRRLFSFLLERMACEPSNMPEGQAIDFGAWAYIMTEEDMNTHDRDLSDTLASIQVPTMILKGECDYCLWDVTYQYKTSIPGSTLVYFEDAGHMIYLDKPQIFMEVVRSFLLDEPLPIPVYTDQTPPKQE
jgi:proline iminopeptidase